MSTSYTYITVDETGRATGMARVHTERDDPYSILITDSDSDREALDWFSQRKPYMPLMYDFETGTWELLPDARPEIKITPNVTEIRAGQKVTLGLDIISYGLRDYAIEGDMIFYIGLDAPSYQGYIRAEFKNGKARDTGFTTRTSGPHEIRTNDIFKQTERFTVIAWEE